MPIYEYRCKSCGHDLEALQKLSDAPLTVCPACHRPELVKRVSAAGFQLKGSGWYATDFRNSGKKQPAKEQGKAAGNGDAKPVETKSSDATSTASSGGAAETSTAPKSSEKTGT